MRHADAGQAPGVPDTPACIREYQRRRYADEREAEQARQRARVPERRLYLRKYDAANPEKAKEQNRKWIAANPEAKRAINRRYGDSHRDEIRERNLAILQRPDRPCRYAKAGCTEFAAVGIPCCRPHWR